MNSWISISLGIFLILCTVPPVSAQVEGVTRGDRVRITAPSVSDSLLTGEVAVVTDRFIRLMDHDVRYVRIHIPLHTIRRLEVRRQVRRTGHGALWGAGIGGFSLGFVWMASASGDDLFGSGQSNGELFWEGARAGLVLGGLIGAVVGTAMKKEKWKRIPVTISDPPVTLHYPDGQWSLRIPQITIKIPLK